MRQAGQLELLGLDLAELTALVEVIGRSEYEVAATNRGIDPTKPAAKGQAKAAVKAVARAEAVAAVARAKAGVPARTTWSSACAGNLNP